jgi:hypothetical protein
MKKITLFVAAAAVLASCNREDALTTQSGNNAGNLNVKNYEQSELQNMITPMAQSFGFNGKAAGVQANYTYRAWAEPVQLDLDNSNIPGATGTVDLSATAAWTVNDIVFVVWHASQAGGVQNAGAYNINAPGPLVGGSITAYKQSGIGQYEFMDRVDFYDADYHEVYGDVNSGTGNYEIMMAGQRAMTTSGYLLSGHNGAVVTRIDYDYINDEFWEGSFREIPLPGTSANDIIGAARRFYVTTGGSDGVDVQGATYELDRNLSNINKGSSHAGGFSGRALAIDPSYQSFVGNLDVDQAYSLSADLNGTARLESTNIFWSGASNNFASFGTLVSSYNPGSVDGLERADLTIATSTDNPFRDPLLIVGPTPTVWSPERTFATLHTTNGAGSVYNFPGGVASLVPNLGNAISTEYDSGLDVLYVAMGGDLAGGGKAIKVIALSNFAAYSVVVNEYDVVGEFADPAIGAKLLSNGSTMTPTITDVKEVTVYGSRNIALAAGSQGVYFIQRDKF